MAGRGNVRVSITADDRGLQQGLRGAESHLSGFAAKGEASLHRLKLAAIGVGTALGGGLVIGLKDSIQAAEGFDKAQAALQQQLKASGITYRAHSKDIDSVISKTEALTGFTKTELTGALTNMIRSTGSVSESLKLMGTTTDVARARNMDLASAAILVAKAHDGNTGALKRLGISITPVTAAVDKLRESHTKATYAQEQAAKATDKNATAQKVLAEFQQKYTGQADAYGKTSAGAAAKFNAALENLKVTVGEKLLPVLTPLVKQAAAFVQQMTTGKGKGGEFVQTLKNIYDAVKPVVKFFTDHPKYIAIAIGAWGAYKVAAIGALALTKAKAVAQFAGLARTAEVEGAASGRAFGGAFGAAMRNPVLTALGAIVAAEPWITQLTGGDLTAPPGESTTPGGKSTPPGRKPSRTNPNSPGYFNPLPGDPGYKPTGKLTPYPQVAKHSQGRSVPMASAASAPGGMGGSPAPHHAAHHSSGNHVLAGAVHRPPPRPSAPTRVPNAGGGAGFTQGAGTNYSVGNEPEIARRLDRLGKALGLHLTGISGARTPQHSVAVGGFADDPHTRGQASDTPGIEGVPESVLRKFGLTRPFPGAAEADHIQLAGSAPGSGGIPVSGITYTSAGGSSTPGASLGGMTVPAAQQSLATIMGNDYTSVTNRISNIGLHQSAGDISQAGADKQTITAITRALGGKYGPLSAHDRLDLRSQSHQAKIDLSSQNKAAAAKKTATAEKISNGKLKSALNLITTMEHNGSVSSYEANQLRLNAFKAALNGYYGKLSSADRAWCKQRIGEINSALAAAQGTSPAAAAMAANQQPDPTTFGGTPFDDAALTEAQIDTPNDTSDDLAVYKGRLGIATAAYNAAKASGDKAGIVTWGAIMQQLTSSIDGLTSAVTDNTQTLLDLQTQSTQQFQALYNTSQAQYTVLMKGLADMVSGQIGGRVGLGFQTPSFAGSGARY